MISRNLADHQNESNLIDKPKRFYARLCRNCTHLAISVLVQLISHYNPTSKDFSNFRNLRRRFTNAFNSFAPNILVSCSYLYETVL